MRILAVIPARGGSKGLPRKNIRTFAGKPLIAWSIEEALKVDAIDTLICSTEDEEIAGIAKQYGCQVPYMRPPELAGDTVSGIDVLVNVLAFYRDQGIEFDALINLQCTSPLRTAAHIEAAIALFQEKEATNLISICEAEHNPHWMMTLTAEGTLSPLMDDAYLSKRRQDLPKIYRPNGAIYIARVDNFLAHRDFKTPAPVPFVMTARDSVDIDDETDFQLAEFFKTRQGMPLE
jgi:CMP-N,N'-diacetyllegionaminic acid synthase